MSVTINDANAHTLLRQAHEHAYRFPETFSGFRAEIFFAKDTVEANGTVEINSTKEVSLEIGLPDTEKKWIQREIASIAGHRWPSSYQEGDGRYSLAFGANNPILGQLVVFDNDPFHSSYTIRNGSIAQVNRQMGAMRFSINIQEHITLPDGHTLPAHFTVAYWNVDEQRLVRSDIYSDRYVEIDGVYCPAMRRVITADDTGLVARSFELRNHQLLAPNHA